MTVQDLCWAGILFDAGSGDSRKKRMIYMLSED